MTPESLPLGWRGLAWVKYHDEHASSSRPYPFVRSAAWRAPISVGGAAWTIYLYFDDFTHGPWWHLEVEDHDDTLVFASERCLPDPDAAWDSLNHDALRFVESPTAIHCPRCRRTHADASQTVSDGGAGRFCCGHCGARFLARTADPPPRRFRAEEQEP